MNERWPCPKCGFRNELDIEYCISCDTPRPDLSATSEVPSYSWISEDTPPSEPLMRYETSPTFAPTFQPTVSPTQKRSTPRRKKPIERTTPSRPTRRALPSLVILVALATIGGAIASHFTKDDSASTTTVTYEWTAADPEDDAYLSTFDQLNEARNSLVETTNSRWNAWLDLESDGFPTEDYLMIDELLAFQSDVGTFSPPVSEELSALHDSWIAEFELLVAAEQALAADPSQATLDADMQAWNDEFDAFSALYNYVQALDI